MRGSLPCTMISLLVMIFERVPVVMAAGICMTRFFYHRNPTLVLLRTCLKEMPEWMLIKCSIKFLLNAVGWE